MLTQIEDKKNEKHNNYLYKKKYMITCVNCGCLGHMYRTCNHPTISYGFICYKLIKDPITNTIYPVYLMVQRKDSLSYVEFIRGKYDLENKTYLFKLFSNMTIYERDRIIECNFDILWKEMWCKNEDENYRNFNREYLEAQDKFNKIKKGYSIKSIDKIINIDINYLFNNTVSSYNETEWGFPKGRRNINENDLSCAIREFKEETGFNPKYLQISLDIKPYEEIFSGTNKKRYKHIYYIAKITNDILNEWNPSSKEIRDVKWFNYDDSQDHIREFNIERKELLKRINLMILKNI